jgi:hypothetical protein
MHHALQLTAIPLRFNVNSRWDGKCIGMGFFPFSDSLAMNSDVMPSMKF